MENLTFTPDERRKLMNGLLHLWRNPAVRPSRETARHIAHRLNELCLQAPRDAFDLNRIVLAIKSIELAVDSIGLRGPVLTAYLVSQAYQGDDWRTVAAEFGPEVLAAIESLRRVQSLEAKVEAMRTDNFRNLLVSQAGDMRVVLLLIAGCVVQMRQIKDSENEAARHDVSTEAAYIYAPLAHKLGLY